MQESGSNEFIAMRDRHSSWHPLALLGRGWHFILSFLNQSSLKNSKRGITKRGITSTNTHGMLATCSGIAGYASVHPLLRSFCRAGVLSHSKEPGLTFALPSRHAQVVVSLPFCLTRGGMALFQPPPAPKRLSHMGIASAGLPRKGLCLSLSLSHPPVSGHQPQNRHAHAAQLAGRHVEGCEGPGDHGHHRHGCRRVPH